MKLTEIKLSGFKSFAKPASLHFKDGLTAIIGPNGSGKSNLAEAVRWVLGEQSAKQLRGSSSTDIIFTGDSEQSKSNKASVSLIFDNESGRFPIEAATVSITRSLSRSGQSEYLLNNDPVRLIDLQQIIAEAGIGAKSYAVISQGTVDRYLTATPAKRRELFDEATGIKSLQIRVGQAENKLKQVDQHTHELQTIIGELEPRLNVLKRQVEKHEAREKYAEEYEEKQSLWFHHAWKKAEAQISKSKDRLEKNRQLTQQACEFRQKIEAELMNDLGRSDSSEDKLKQDLETAKQTYHHEKTSYEENQRLHRSLRASIEKVTAHLKTAQKELDQARRNSNLTNSTDNVKNTLKKCLQLIEKIKAKEPIDKKFITQLTDDINESIKLAHTHADVNRARSAFAGIEQPIQEVAKLKAILAEREQQLKALPSLKESTYDAVETLQAKLQNRLSVKQEVDVTEKKQALEKSRNSEIEAARQEQATELKLEQANKEVTILKATILRERGTHFLQQIEKSDAPKSTPPAEQELHQLAKKLAVLGEADPLALKEYEEVSARYNDLATQLEDILATKERIEHIKQKLEKEMTTRFHDQLKIITSAFAKYFIQLFGGGVAQLDLQDEGIDILVCPPGKKTRNINLLSGGEKALTSLALLFAILEAQQPPFLVLDEVDAALDEANADRFAKTLKEKSSKIQCIVITHNRQTMSQADVLYGVTMNKSNTSKIYSVNLKDHDFSEQKITT